MDIKLRGTDLEKLRGTDLQESQESEGYELITGATEAEFTSDSLKTWAWYQVEVSSCGSIKRSSDIEVEVFPKLEFRRTLNSSQNICYKQDAMMEVELKGGNATNYHYLWENSLDGLNELMEACPSVEEFFGIGARFWEACPSVEEFFGIGTRFWEACPSVEEFFGIKKSR